MFGILGFVVGVAILAFAWFPESIIEWFFASLIPGVVALRLMAVPEGYSPSRGFAIFAGLWAALFWVPFGVAILHQVGLLK